MLTGFGRFDAGPTIFGNVANGVPNPLVPHLSPWPTRYHGSAFMYPDARRRTYVEQAYQVPYPSFGDTPPLFASATGSNLVDGILGGVAGFAIAKPEDRMAMTAVGVVASFLAGTIGILGTLGVGVYTRRREI